MFIPDPPSLPQDPLFDSAWLKWGRAVVHMQTLHADLDTFGPDGGREPTLAVRTEYHPKRHGFGVYISDIDPMPPTWGLILGDVANNLRSALDQLAWALVTRGRTPPPTLTERQRRGIYFPISDQRDKFNRCLATRLPGVRRADIAKVRRYQPYHRGTKGRWFALTLLAELNASDKHRTVQPVWAVPITTEMEITYQRDCVVPSGENRATRKPLEIGTELAFIRARKTGPDPHVEVKPLLTAEPSFKHLVLMREWLKTSVWWIQQLLYEFSDTPDDISALGIDIDWFETAMRWRRPDM